MRLLATVVLLAALTACSGDDPQGADEGTRSGGSAELPAPEELASYFDAVASYDLERLEQAQEAAADGSAAEGYAAYLGELAASAVAGGQPVPGAEAVEVEGGYQACGGSGAADECVTWTGIEGADGELTGFAVDGTPVADSLVDLTGQPPIEIPGLYAVQPTWAYHSPQSRSLVVLVDVTSRDLPLEVRPGTYIERDLILDTVPSRGPATVAAGATEPVILAFAEAAAVTLDGEVTFGLGVGGGVEESVGFGLTPPAV